MNSELGQQECYFIDTGMTSLINKQSQAKAKTPTQIKQLSKKDLFESRWR
ncbi:hypothetical protein [Shewanella loihica]|nr:hypothetical protein [Shewanella loihica]